MQSNPNDVSKKQNKKDPKKFMQLFFIGFGICLVMGALVCGLIALATGAIGSHDQLLSHGDSAFAEGSYEKAIGHYQKALEAQEDSVKARVGLCKAYEMLEQYEQMEEVAMRGITLSPATYEFYAYKIKALVLRGDIDGAHAFMGQITNEHVLLKMEHNKPGEVRFSTKGGTYGAPITVELSADDGATIYYTNDGSKPSTQSAVYSEAFQVKHGTLTLRGFAMSQTGLISDPFEVTYMVRDGNAAYTFKDSAISYMAHAMLDVPTSKALTYSMIDKITSFNTWDITTDQSIRSLEDLKEFGNLTEVHLYNQTGIDDFGVLAEIPTLRKLTLDNCKVTDDLLRIVAGITQITELTLDNNSIENVQPLSALTDLKFLSLCNNKLTEIRGLDKLENLTTLVLVGNQISDLSSIQGLKTLTELSVADNAITSLLNAKDLTGLTKLDLSGNQLTALSGISALAALESLTAIDCGITDISAISKLTGLVEVDFSGNPIDDLSPLRQTGVTSLTVVDCNIQSLGVVRDIRTLRTLNVSDNPIEDVTPLISLPTLERLDISNTKVTMIVGLRGCGTLHTIRAIGCRLDDVDGMEGSNIKLEQ